MYVDQALWSPWILKLRLEAMSIKHLVSYCYELKVFQKAWVLRRLACWDCRFESRWGHGCLSFVNVLCYIGRDLCDGLITCPGKSYRVCLSPNVIRCSNKPLPLQSVGRRGQAKTERKKRFRQMCSYPHLLHIPFRII